jgi:hypothetical protein
MDLYVYSRHALEAARPHEVPHIVIAIMSAADDVARLRRNDQCKVGSTLLSGCGRPLLEQAPALDSA